MAGMRTVVIVGAGLTAGAAAAGLREEGFDGRVVVVGEEPHPPYERPPLSKELLRGEQDRDAVFVRPRSWYEEQEVDLRLGIRAERLDPAGPAVELAGGERIAADAVLLATGGRPRVLADPSDRILYLRTIEDAERIRDHLRPGHRLVVVGGGFIGAEVAASARGMGADVTMLEMAAVPLEAVLGREIGEVYAAIHRDHGVDLRTEAVVSSVEESAGGVVVRTRDGEAVEGDAAVIGVGIVPADEVAREAGLEVGDGVVVDERCRTSAPGVFAAGDVARHHHPVFGRPIRVEHFDNALRQGAAAARSMLGREEPYDHPHWFWSDQYDVNLQMAGHPGEWDRMVVRGSLGAWSFAAFYLREGVLVAALSVNRGRDVRRTMKLIGARARPDPDRLADEDVDLRTLLPPS